MATNGITAIEAYAQVLLERAGRWTKSTRTDGTEFVLFISSRMTPDDQPIYYYCRRDAKGCTCPGYWYRGTCAHTLAVQADNERKAAQPARKSYRDLYNVCDERGCDEDREPHENYCSKHVLVDAF